MSLLPVCPAYELENRPPERQWLIETLWGEEAVGIVGGEPKCCKSFLALEMAVAIASGNACLRRFLVPTSGRVLLYAAEDALHIVRRRLEGICRSAGLKLEGLDLQVITVAGLRLDLPVDRERLEDTVAQMRPRLLVLDPFVRLHRIDENNSGEVAPLLAYLRQLQRTYRVAVVVVHHAKKGAGKARAGQALRGSSEFHAWGDSNLYLRRMGENLTLSVEHRAAPSQAAIPLQLQEEAEALSLALVPPKVEETAVLPASAIDKIEAVLAGSASPLSITALRCICRLRTQTVSTCLAELVKAGRATKTSAGYVSPKAASLGI